MTLTGKELATIQTPSGDVVIRYLKEGDAAAMLRFINDLSRERTFILFQGEQLTLAQEEAWLQERLAEIRSRTGISLGAFCGEDAIGSTGVILKPLAERHVGVFGLSVSRPFRGMGIGAALFDAAIAESIAQLEGMRIIELTVMAPNEVARQLYRSRGFVEHGALPRGVRYRDTLVDHILMHREFDWPA